MALNPGLLKVLFSRILKSMNMIVEPWVGVCVECGNHGSVMAKAVCLLVPLQGCVSVCVCVRVCACGCVSLFVVLNL